MCSRLAGMDPARIVDNVRQVAERLASDRYARQRRRELEPADFAALADAGFLLTGVPARLGGVFESVARSSRPIGEILTVLARGDSSVALVSAMHAAVLGFWHATPDVPEPDRAAWREQSEQMSRHALDGAWFGTITSEPGSGGDVARTQTVARRGGDGEWRLTGKKHFGSGSGVTSFMLTSGRAEGEADPDWFVLDMRSVPWDGTRGVKLIAPWDGHGMIATQSHGMELTDFPALRFAWPG
ncbi:MAG: acyl-CoA dehydrogenase, partial [Lysobacterales bacterium]